MFTIRSVRSARLEGHRHLSIDVAADEDLIGDGPGPGPHHAAVAARRPGPGRSCRAMASRPADPIDVIDQHLAAGTYSLAGRRAPAATGTFTLTTMLTPAAAPFQPIPVGTATRSADRGGRLQRRRPARPGRRQLTPTARLGAAGQRRRHVPAPGHLRGGVGPRRDRGGRLHRRRPASTWPSPTDGDNTVSVLLGNGDGTFQPQVTYAVGSVPDAIVAGDFNGDGQLDLAVANDDSTTRRVGAAGQRRRHVPAPGHLRGGVGPRRHRGGRLQRRRPARPGRRQRELDNDRLGAAGQRRRHVPAPGHLRGGVESQTPSWRATSTATASSTWPSPTSARQRRLGAAGQRRRHVPARRSPTRWGRAQTPSWRATSTATAGSTWPSPTSVGNTVSVLLGNGDGTFQPQVDLRGGVGTQSPSWRGTSTATAGSTWPSPTTTPTTVSVLLGNGDGTFQPQVTDAVGSSPDAIVAGDFNGDGRLDLAVANCVSNDRVGAAGQRRRHVPAPGHLRGGVGPRRHRGGRLQRRRPARPGRRQLRLRQRPCRCCWATATAPSSPRSTYAVGSDPVAIVAGDFNGDGRLDLAVANCGLRRRRRCCWATATARSSPRSPTRWGRTQIAIVAGDFNGDGRLDLAVANYDVSDDVSVLLGNGDGTFQPAGDLRGGVGPDRHRGGRLQRRRPARPGRRQLRLGNDVSVLLGNGDGTFQPQVTVRGGVGPRRHRGGGLQRRRPPRPGRRQRRRRNDVSVLLGNGDGTFQPAGHLRGGIDPSRASWRATSTATASSTWPSPTTAPTTSRCCWATATARSADPGQFATTPHATPLVADVNGDGTDDVLVVDGAGNILYRQGIPGQPGTFEPPVTVNPGYPLARHRLAARTPIKAPCSPASTPRTTPSRSTPTATAVSSG